MFAYCGNNPVSRADHGGQFWNVIIGAVVGAAASAVAQMVTNAIEKRPLTDGLASAVVVGAVGGAIAATGMGMFAQAAWTTVAAFSGDALQQGIDSGFKNIKWGQSVRTGLVAGATSLIGSQVGKKIFGGIEDLGKSYISKGHQQNFTGITRALKGKSHTSYYCSGMAYVEKGKRLVNFYRGVSSCVGSFIGISTGFANNLIPD